MALIAIAADKGSPGVTTAAVALATVWPRPVLLAECDPAGGDLAYRLPAAGGARLDTQRGLLSLAIAARRGLPPDQVWEHCQQLPGGLAVLTGVASAEQGAGLDALWRPVGEVLSRVREADVIADCGRLGVDGPPYDLLAQASLVVLVMRASLGELVRIRERAATVAACGQRRGVVGPTVCVVAVAGQRDFSGTLAELSRALDQGKSAAKLIGGLAYEPKTAEVLSGQAGGNPAKSLLIRSAHDIAIRLLAQLPDEASAVPEVEPAAIPARARPAQIESPRYRQSWPPPGEPSGPGHESPDRPARSDGNGVGRDPAARPLRGAGDRPALADQRTVVDQRALGDRRRDYPRAVPPEPQQRRHHRAVDPAQPQHEQAPFEQAQHDQAQHGQAQHDQAQHDQAQYEQAQYQQAQYEQGQYQQARYEQAPAPREGRR
jgi:hypothetical protein